MKLESVIGSCALTAHVVAPSKVCFMCSSREIVLSILRLIRHLSSIKSNYSTLENAFSPQRRGVSSEEEEGEVDSEVELPRRRYLVHFHTAACCVSISVCTIL